MTAPHFFVPSLAEPDVWLSAADSRHALRVLRLRPGEDVSLADGAGAVATGRLTREDAGIAVVALDRVRRVVRRGPLLSVAFAPPKGDRLGWAVQKLAELGVDEAVLVRTDRSVRAWDEGRAARAVDRLQSVAREAAMQSRQPFLMEVRAAEDLAGQVVSGPNTTVILWEKAEERLSSVLPRDASAIGLIVGPEGGLTDAEVDGAAAAGAGVASLGPSILRTETAAVVGAALVLARDGRLG